MPIVSILIPAYNRDAIIHKTIESALNQTVSDIEVIIVDNNSTDGTFEVCQNYACKDSRVHLYRNQENIGPVRNWITCARLASAPYAKLLFSDDLIAPTYLEKTLPMLRSEECALVFTPAIIGEYDWQGEINYNVCTNDTLFSNLLYISTAVLYNKLLPVSPGAALLRTEDMQNNILTHLKGITDFDFCRYGAGIDWLIYMLTVAQYSQVGFIAEPLAFFRSHTDSITVKNENDMVKQGYNMAIEWFNNMVMKG